MGLDKNQITGILILIILFVAWTWINAPTKEEIAEQQRIRDSIELAEIQQAREMELTPQEAIKPDTAEVVEDSVQIAAGLRSTYGSFAPAASGTERSVVLENEHIQVTFSNKGGRITDVLIKDHDKIVLNEEKKEVKVPLHLMNDDNDVFNYVLPVQGAAQGMVSTGDLFFDVTKEGNTVVFEARGLDGTSFLQRYTLQPDHYVFDYDIEVNGLRAGNLGLNWVTYLDKIEKNSGYEKYYTSVYYKEIDDDPDYCNCRKSDVDDRRDQRIRWVSHSNQFFNTSLIADESFGGGVMETEMLDDDDENLKILRTEVEVPLSGAATENFGMTLYVGPNEFERLRQFHASLEDIIPFGRSIFGTINRWVIRPIFNFLAQFFNNQGIVILMLTFLVKIALFPLTYRMLLSQAKMSVLKPKLAGIKEKHKDDMQQQQMETMKIYREFGVSPLGGCLPMVAQMPIWFALYRFFPASIEFRQEGFLWATDLSSYDVFFNLPFEIPFYGGHVSLLTLLWVLTTLIYTYYNTRHMDMASINPMMKYMQYFMPVMFLFFFNNYASGLTLYLLFSNVLNIGLTIGTKHFVFDDDKLLAELEANKAKPKKKGGFQERLQKALEEQQRVQSQKQGSSKKK